MSIWARYDLVDAFLNSRRIKSDILDLFSELAWCGVSFQVSTHRPRQFPTRMLLIAHTQDFDGKKQMAEEGDTAELLNLLYTIIRNDDNLHRLSEQSPEVIRFLVHFLQQVLPSSAFSPRFFDGSDPTGRSALGFTRRAKLGSARLDILLSHRFN